MQRWLEGMASLRVLGLSVTGRGNETAAHLLRLPRMTLMFCAFDCGCMARPVACQIYLMDANLAQTS